MKRLTKMYNDKLYEDYGFLQKHCSPELLKNLQDAYPYDSDGPAYASEFARYLRPDILFDPSAIKAYLMSAEKENIAEVEVFFNIIFAGNVLFQ